MAHPVHLITGHVALAIPTEGKGVDGKNVCLSLPEAGYDDSYSLNRTQMDTMTAIVLIVLRWIR